MLMKIHKGAGWRISCDECSEEAEFEDAATFEDALTAAKAAGWIPVQIKGAWEHRCPSCQEEAKKDPFAK
jgi:hypothetical protein